MTNLYQIWHEKRCRIIVFKETTARKVRPAQASLGSFV